MRITRELPHARREIHDLERVVAIEAIERGIDGGARLRERLTRHRPRRIDDEHHLDVLPAQSRRSRRWIDEQREIPLLRLRVRIGQEVRLDLLARDAKLEHEVAVGNRAAARELDVCERLAVAARGDGVRGRELLDGDAGIDVDADREIVRRALARPQIADGRAGCRFAKVLAGHGDDGIARAHGVVAGPDDRREHERVPTVLVRERVEVADVDVDALARLDVRDLLLEDVRPLLHEQARTVALRARILVDLPRLLLLAQDAADLALADRHHELVDGGLLGQREDVHGLDLLVVRVLELLRDVDGRDVARRRSRARRCGAAAAAPRSARRRATAQRARASCPSPATNRRWPSRASPSESPRALRPVALATAASSRRGACRRTSRRRARPPAEAMGPAACGRRRCRR